MNYPHNFYFSTEPTTPPSEIDLYKLLIPKAEKSKEISNVFQSKQSKHNKKHFKRKTEPNSIKQKSASLNVMPQVLSPEKTQPRLQTEIEIEKLPQSSLQSNKEQKMHKENNLNTSIDHLYHNDNFEKKLDSSNNDLYINWSTDQNILNNSETSFDSIKISENIINRGNSLNNNSFENRTILAKHKALKNGSSSYIYDKTDISKEEIDIYDFNNMPSTSKPSVLYSKDPEYAMRIFLYEDDSDNIKKKIHKKHRSYWQQKKLKKPNTNNTFKADNNITESSESLLQNVYSYSDSNTSSTTGKNSYTNKFTDNYDALNSTDSGSDFTSESSHSQQNNKWIIDDTSTTSISIETLRTKEIDEDDDDEIIFTSGKRTKDKNIFGIFSSTLKSFFSSNTYRNRSLNI